MPDNKVLKLEMPGNEVFRLNGAFPRGASRREVMNFLLAAGVSISAAGTFAGTAQAETPRRGGRIRVACNQNSSGESLDPARSFTANDWSRVTMFYNTLTRIDENLTPQLELAEDISSTERATVWNIKLRRDVRFHDGSPLTAADVVYSLQRHKDAAVRSGARVLVEPMVEITETGAHEVRIRLSGPDVGLPSTLGVLNTAIVKAGTTDFRTANGTGPYKCREFEPGVRSIAVRNEEYFKSGKPFLDEIEVIGITDEPARVNALLAGDVHFVALINARSAQRIKSAPNAKLFETQAGAFHSLAISRDHAPGANSDFVLSVKHMLNREQIRRAVYRNYAIMGNDQPVPPSSAFYDPSLPQRPYDLDKARFHLRRSGFANQTLPIFVSPAAANSEEIAQILQQTGREVGVTFNLQRIPADSYWSNTWMKQPIFFGSNSPKASVDISLSFWFHSRSPYNESAFRNERFDALLINARAEADINKRNEMYSEMQRIIHESSGTCIPVFYTFLDAHVSNLKGLRPIPTGSMMGWNYAENIWLEQ
ncbi:ABC transporter substrate-binding protein [Bradyrhizobium arachidis]|uniref:ABC transporter substrate-binding protein n=1 Tax=Bradyrhizobium arachidis TaxID=858423 RepID=UPI0021623FCB|nr:ABC transporter substrate-binding protein [Bradyrhizobium arachidis]UVO30450.1 ABC transporter substrate-binding protein [Bradyrhizobium arachidis]